jgi:hypothetical protein
VQIDAVVTDQRGKQITDLKQEDSNFLKPGEYQLGVAVRDPRVERVGSASQFIDVPDISRNRLTLSGVVISGFDPLTARRAPSRDPNNEGLIEAIDPATTPAVRMLTRGTYLDYGFLIYNAELDPATKKPQLETQVLLLKKASRFSQLK